jgi:hypothetical protein
MSMLRKSYFHELRPWCELLIYNSGFINNLRKILLTILICFVNNLSPLSLQLLRVSM